MNYRRANIFGQGCTYVYKDANYDVKDMFS